MNINNIILFIIIILSIILSHSIKENLIYEEIKTNKISQEINLNSNSDISFEKISSDKILSSRKLKTETYNNNEIQKFLKSQGISKFSLFDRKYYLIDWNTWQKIIKVDTINKEYTNDTFDCDNYSFLFASRMSYLFNLNSVGVVFGKSLEFGKTFNIRTNEHSFNLILSYNENKELELYIYEPMNDKWIKYNKNNVFKKYKIYSVIYF